MPEQSTKTFQITLTPEEITLAPVTEAVMVKRLADSSAERMEMAHDSFVWYFRIEHPDGLIRYFLAEKHATGFIAGHIRQLKEWCRKKGFAVCHENDDLKPNKPHA